MFALLPTPSPKRMPSGRDGLEVELRSDGSYIQWRYKGYRQWNNIISVKELIGPRGQTGQIGSRGEAGPKGASGEKGDRGEKGEKGDRGLQGVQGEIGPAGPRGLIGKSGTNGTGYVHQGIIRTSSTTDPTTTEYPNDKDAGIHKNTTSGDVFLSYNDGGTIKKVQLT